MPSGENKSPPLGYVAKIGSGPCLCTGSGVGLDSCGELCCAASPYTDPDPNGKHYYGNDGKTMADMCYEKAADQTTTADNAAAWFWLGGGTRGVVGGAGAGALLEAWESFLLPRNTPNIRIRTSNRSIDTHPTFT